MLDGLGVPVFHETSNIFQGVETINQIQSPWAQLSEASPIRSVATDLAGVAMERCQADDPRDLHIYETVYEVFSEGDEITTDRKLNWFVNQVSLHFLDEVKDSILLPLACDESWLTHGFEPSQPRGVHKTWQRFLSLLYHENLDSCFNKHRVWSLDLMYQKAPDSTYIIMYTYIIDYNCIYI